MKFNKSFWNQKYKEGRVYREVSEIMLDKILPRKKGSVLDIGSGTGILARQLDKRGFKVTGIDLSDFGISQAKSLDPEHNITYMVGDFMEMDIENKYDVVVVNKVLAFNDTEAFLSRVRDVLVPGGLLILITPVMRSEYADKYNEHLRSISVDYSELEHYLGLLFGGGVFYDSQYFGDYGEEVTVVTEGA